MILKIRKQHKTIWSERQKEVWDPPREIEVSQWADDFRVLHPMTSAEPGRWRTIRTPYLKGIMDAFNDPLVEEITVMASTQIGKTEGMYNMLAYAIDQDPGPALLVMPREADARAFLTIASSLCWSHPMHYENTCRTWPTISPSSNIILTI